MDTGGAGRQRGERRFPVGAADAGDGGRRRPGDGREVEVPYDDLPPVVRVRVGVPDGRRQPQPVPVAGQVRVALAGATGGEPARSGPGTAQRPDRGGESGHGPPRSGAVQEGQTGGGTRPDGALVDEDGPAVTTGQTFGGRVHPDVAHRPDLDQPGGGRGPHRPRVVRLRPRVRRRGCRCDLPDVGGAEVHGAHRHVGADARDAVRQRDPQRTVLGRGRVPHLRSGQERGPGARRVEPGQPRAGGEPHHAGDVGGDVPHVVARETARRRGDRLPRAARRERGGPRAVAEPHRAGRVHGHGPHIGGGEASGGGARREHGARPVRPSYDATGAGGEPARPFGVDHYTPHVRRRQPGERGDRAVPGQYPHAGRGGDPYPVVPSQPVQAPPVETARPAQPYRPLRVEYGGAVGVPARRYRRDVRGGGPVDVGLPAPCPVSARSPNPRARAAVDAARSARRATPGPVAVVARASEPSPATAAVTPVSCALNAAVTSSARAADGSA